MTGRHLQRARAEVELNALVADHRDAPLDERDDHLAADRVAPSLVAGIHGDGNVGEDRRHARGRDRHATLRTVGERIERIRQRVVDLAVDQLQVRQRRLVKRTPVDDPVRAIDPPLAIQVHEEAHHGAHVVVVHREALAPVVHRRAHAPELLHDLAAVLAQPVPDELLELLAAELLTTATLLGQVLLDGVLRRDAGVVVPRLEQRVETPHALVAHERVGERELKRVTGMELTRDVRRRVRDDEGRPRIVGLGGVKPLVLPGALPAPLDTLRLVQRLHHASLALLPRGLRQPVRSRRNYASEYSRASTHVCRSSMTRVSCRPTARRSTSRSSSFRSRATKGCRHVFPSAA